MTMLVVGAFEAVDLLDEGTIVGVTVGPHVEEAAEGTVDGARVGL